MIIENCAPATYDLVVHTGSGLLAGVGRAYYAGLVGVASLVYGVAGSSAIVGKSPLYMGCIGGNTAVSYLAVWSPKMSGTTKLWYGGNGSVTHVTVYDVPIEKRKKGGQLQKFTASVFAKCDFFADEPLVFEECLFAADCRWVMADGEELDQEGTSGQERLDLLLGGDGRAGNSGGKPPEVYKLRIQCPDVCGIVQQCRCRGLDIETDERRREGRPALLRCVGSGVESANP